MKIIKRNDKILIFISLLLFFSIACEKETGYEVLSGQLVGYISLYDNELHKMSDYSGVEVIIEGSNPQIKASTDKDGRFIINNLKSGTYNIVFKKDFFCQHKIVSYQFVGGNKPATLYEIALYSLPNILIDRLMITDIESKYNVDFGVTARVSYQDQNTNVYCRFFLSNQPDVSYKNYVSTNIAYSNFYDNENISFNLRIDTLKFPIGSELYMILYPAIEPWQYYIDINSGKFIYTSIDINRPSEIANITIPDVETPWWLE